MLHGVGLGVWLGRGGMLTYVNVSLELLREVDATWGDGVGVGLG